MNFLKHIKNRKEKTIISEEHNKTNTDSPWNNDTHIDRLPACLEFLDLVPYCGENKEIHISREKFSERKKRFLDGISKYFPEMPANDSEELTYIVNHIPYRFTQLYLLNYYKDFYRYLIGKEPDSF